ncbi:flagellar biosynthesis protein FlgA [Micromonospora sp. PLK6-60]|uniref:flagellar biosynthesis protein FlgA n=1 Tax=Micromonospora sp. PLK6-60 TaxID=2873383 RepID=UPI001CA72B5B|nr:flagellar biosynthesis protein FlgA [Micromonospora sp. PLK6-60]MBY8871588.1 flagellar biosynthesis protein FlgA [Micromonospora sp. PLK6-60]
MGGKADPLRPARRPRLPRGGTLVRIALVAALLGLAAAVLKTPAGCPPTATRVRPAAPATTGGAPATGAPLSPGGALPLPPGAVGVPVRLAEPAALAVLRPGARVDLLVVPAGGRTAETVLVAAGARVLDVVGADVADGSSALYLALTPEQARRAVGQPEGSRFAVVVRG